MAMKIDRRRLLLSGLAALSLKADTKPIRVGVLGTGARGVDMMRISLKLPGVRIAAVCDISEANATRAQQIVEEATGQRPAPFTRGPEDYRRMLERPDLDVILVMTPQNQHAAQSIHAMAAGKHVGSETP